MESGKMKALIMMLFHVHASFWLLRPKKTPSHNMGKPTTKADTLTLSHFNLHPTCSLNPCPRKQTPVLSVHLCSHKKIKNITSLRVIPTEKWRSKWFEPGTNTNMHRRKQTPRNKNATRHSKHFIAV